MAAGQRNLESGDGLTPVGEPVGAELTAVLDIRSGVLDADTDLMLRFQAGEVACFDTLVARFQKPLLGFVYRFVGDGAAGEEIVQEAFLRVYLHRDRYRPKARFSTWVYRIAHHLALNYLRDHRRDRRMNSLDEPDGPGETLARELPDQAPNTEQALVSADAAQERRRRVRVAIAALPERQRAAVILHKYQGLDYQEIAGSLAVSESALKSLLFRAYTTLRRELHDLL